MSATEHVPSPTPDEAFDDSPTVFYLIEAAPGLSLPDDGDRIAAVADRLGGRLVERQVTREGLAVSIVETSVDQESVETALADDGLSFSSVALVRLVGATADEVVASNGKLDWLVEWDLPRELGIDTYLERKAEKTPLYASVPEVTFSRTYVREDMDKCLCFYEGGCEDDVVRARDAVGAPIDRLHELGSDSDDHPR